MNCPSDGRDANLVAANRDKIAACRAAAAKTKQEERCTMSVPPGE
jgi:hypothetical protein